MDGGGGQDRRREYTNVYLDSVTPAPDEDDESGPDSEPEEEAWRTAVDAAPWLVGSKDNYAEVPPDELFEKLKPFKDRVAEDIREDD